MNIKLNEINRGTNAGGANTNLYGKKFEDKTNNKLRLLNNGYIENNFTSRNLNYLYKVFDNKKIIFTTQFGFKTYMKNKYNIQVFRCPDEAYIIEYNTGKSIIKILEKKEQRVEGSVEIKLWAGPSLKREYQLVMGHNFEIHYGFCVSEFLKTKLTSNETKYKMLNIIFSENDIPVLFGDDEDYFEKLDEWLGL